MQRSKSTIATTGRWDDILRERERETNNCNSNLQQQPRQPTTARRQSYCWCTTNTTKHQDNFFADLSTTLAQWAVDIDGLVSLVTCNDGLREQIKAGQNRTEGSSSSVFLLMSYVDSLTDYLIGLSRSGRRHYINDMSCTARQIKRERARETHKGV